MIAMQSTVFRSTNPASKPLRELAVACQRSGCISIGLRKGVESIRERVSFQDLATGQAGVVLLQRSLARGRLGHAYLFTGVELAELERVARTLAKTLLCQQPVRSAEGAPVDCCERCSACRRVESGSHPDVHWVRPESKLRVITIDQVRDLSREMFLKPHEAAWKVGILVDADCLNLQAANALLKTLEEPPSRSLLVLLSREPARLLETIVSRCMRVHFASGSASWGDAEQAEWVRGFAELAVESRHGVIDRYRLVDLLLQRLAAERGRAESEVKARWTEGPEEEPAGDSKSGIETESSEGVEEGPTGVKGGSEAGLKAAIEAEYRQRRERLLGAIQAWLRDVWLLSLGEQGVRLVYPHWHATLKLASRITQRQALRNLSLWEELQWLLRRTNVQELLALETAVLQLELGDPGQAAGPKGRGESG